MTGTQGGLLIRKAVMLVTCLVLLLSLAPIGSRKDPDTGRIRVLYIGDHGAKSPSPMMDAEPLISLRVASAIFYLKGDLRKRLNRLYFPRTYRALAEHDAIIISDAPVDQFDNKHYTWFKNAVVQNGSGFVMVGGNGGFGGSPELPWTPTAVQDILPVWCINGEWNHGRVEILEPDHELLSTLSLDKRWEWMALYGGNKVSMKQEADLLAEITGRVEASPLWATWDIGEGRCFAQTCDWTPAGGNVFMRWRYYGDFAINLMMYLSQNPIPSDLETLHRARSLYLDYRSIRGYAFQIMDFVERLGANMAPVGKIIGEADQKHAQSVDEYLQFEFQTALETLESSIDDLRRASGKAMQLKDQAMFWIYLIQWLVVTATFAIGGVILWSLMVRRRLYREIESTRFTR